MSVRDDAGAWHLFAAELPDHRAQLELVREAEPVVDAPEVVVGVEQHVAALAVGVVVDQVEERERLQRVVQILTLFVDGEVVLLVVGIDEPLHAALADGAVAQHGGRHDAQAQRLAQPVGGVLALVQAGLEVPQRPFTGERLVDRLADLLVVEADLREALGAGLGMVVPDLDHRCAAHAPAPACRTGPAG